MQKSLKNHSLAIIKNKEISCTQFCLTSPGTMVSASCDHLGQLVKESCFQVQADWRSSSSFRAWEPHTDPQLTSSMATQKA